MALFEALRQGSAISFPTWRETRHFSPYPVEIFGEIAAIDFRSDRRERRFYRAEKSRGKSDRDRNGDEQDFSR
ncbi:MAG: hypothetical protein ACLQIQ_08765 [Beijerinckiaceae bacterium]